MIHRNDLNFVIHSLHRAYFIKLQFLVKTSFRKDVVSADLDVIIISVETSISNFCLSLLTVFLEAYQKLFNFPVYMKFWMIFECKYGIDRIYPVCNVILASNVSKTER